MIGLVGVAGLAGVGKTTAAMHLSEITGGKYLYLGQTVLDEVRARGLSGTPDDESRVRIDLRRENGPEALAIPHIEVVSECMVKQIPVFVDAIFKQEEFDLLASRVPNGFARLLAIDASFDIRSTRLASRTKRPFNSDELLRRDTIELKKLGTADVLAAAGYTISNEQTFGELYRELAAFVSCCG